MKWNQMTAQRFQTGWIYQAPLAFFGGQKIEKKEKKELVMCLKS